MKLLARTISRSLLIVSIIVFFAAGTFGISHLGMTSDANGQMSNCPFMGVAALCDMNPLEHIAAWQNMFTAVPFKGISALALLLLAFFAVFLWRDFWNTRWVQSISNHSQYFRNKTFLIRNELQEALSAGILHPKLF